MTPEQKFVLVYFAASFIGGTYLAACILIWEDRPKWKEHVMREVEL
jgi:hypothetical protein